MKSNYKNSYIVADKELVSLSVYNVGFQKCDSLHQWGPGIRDHYLIHYVISGKGLYSVNGSTHAISAGDVFLVYPNTEITYIADENNPWEYAWIGFSGSDASIILSATDFTKEKPFIKNISYGDKLRKEISLIYDCRGNEFEHALEMTGHLYTLLSIFIHEAKAQSQENTSNIYVQKSIEYINANYSYPISVEDIASYVGVSRSHLFRCFETVLNISPKEYLTEFRIKQACYLLEHSDLSIKVIANSIGFADSLHFSKAFKNTRGISPTYYRLQHQG